MQKIAGFIVDYHKLIVILLSAITLIFGTSIPRLGFDPSVESFLENNPESLIYQKAKEEFGSDEFIAVSFRTRDVFTIESLRLIDKITRDIENLQNIDRVISITNVKKIRPTQDGFDVSPLIKQFPQKEDELRHLKQEALSTPLYLENIISEDATTTAIIAIIKDIPGNELYRYKLVKQVQDIIKGHSDAGIQFYLSGVPLLKSNLVDYMKYDLNIFVPLIFLVLLIINFFIFRNLRGTFIPILVIGISLGWTMGFFTSQGRKITTITTMLPPMVISYVVTYATHIISQYYEACSVISDKRGLIKETIGRIILPCLMSCLTTAVGFSSLAVSNIIPVRDFGLFSAAGVVFGFILAITLVPIILLYLKVAPRVTESDPKFDFIGGVVKRLAPINQRRKYLILVLSLAVLLISIHGISRLEIESDPIRNFKKKSHFSLSTRFMEEHLGGAQTLEIVLYGKGEDSVLGPGVLEKVEGLERFLRGLPAVRKTISLNDFLKEMNQAMSKGNPGYYRLPGSEELAAQYLLLYSMSGEERDLQNYINNDHSALCLTARISENSSTEILKMVRSTRDYIQKNFEKEWGANVTGHPVAVANMMDSIIKGQINSLALTVLILSSMMALVFRSLKIGIISMIPNIIPVFLTLGMMGWWGIPLDMATSMISCVALGMIIDDTIYITTRFKSELEKTRDYYKALEITLLCTDRPVIYTSLILTGCFAILMTSNFVPTIYFGFLTSFTILTALIADLFLTPALLLVFKPWPLPAD